LERAKTAFAAGEASRGAVEVQRILDELREDLIVVPPEGGSKRAPATQVRYVPAPEVATSLLLRLPEKDRAVYEETQGAAAKVLLDRAEARRDEAGLREVMLRFGATKAGAAAGRRWVDSALEAGRARDAAAAARDALRLV